MSRVLYIGRFQPLHKGHLKAIKYVLNKAEELVIVIGSAEKSHSLDNPFTAGERVMMIRLALDEMGIEPSKYYLIPIPDVNMHSIWVPQVISYLPRFDLVYSNDSLTSRLFTEFGIKVEKIPFFNREIYSATEVRKRILTGENWKVLLPPSVIVLIQKIGGIERLKELALTDTSVIEKNQNLTVRHNSSFKPN
jgi:nicotinamide-nucleotide adenylyltransferase